MEKTSIRLPVCNGQDLEAGLEQVTRQVLQSDGVPVITDRASAYAISMEYDRIRDALMRDREVWEQFQYLYWYKKYQSYFMVCGRLDASLKEEFLNRMRREFKRAMQLGQLKESDFEAAQWRHIRKMVILADGPGSKISSHRLVRKISPYVPEYMKYWSAECIGLAAKAKRFMAGVLR